jgi:hypothetical protein
LFVSLLARNCLKLVDTHRTIDPSDNGWPYRVVVLIHLPLIVTAIATGTDQVLLRYVALFSDIRL